MISVYIGNAFGRSSLGARGHGDRYAGAQVGAGGFFGAEVSSEVCSMYYTAPSSLDGFQLCTNCCT